jgi:hypothetical protein
VAVAGQEDHPVAPVNAVRLMGREDDGDPARAESAQQSHHVSRSRGIEPGGGFVQEENAWPGQELHGDAGPLALAAGQCTHRHVGPIGQVQVAQGLLDDPLRFHRGCARRQPQQGRVAERAAQGHLEVDDVVLGHVADLRVGADAGPTNDAVLPNLPGGRRLQSGEDLQQSGLPRAAAAGDGDQFTGFHRERQLVEDLPATDAPAHVDRIDTRAWSPRLRQPDGCCVACQFAHDLVSVHSRSGPVTADHRSAAATAA